MNDNENRIAVLRNLPAIDKLLQSKTSLKLIETTGTKHLTGLARLVTESLRGELNAAIESGDDFDSGKFSADALLKEAEQRLADAWKREQETGLRRVINASGVIVHTNLGRAPLSEPARKAAFQEASGYCSLEYDVTTGERGKRGGRAAELLAQITGAESALIVNNCAAACLLVLNTFAKGGETVISRGELVEIGGDFRVPDVMEQSGTKLVEVGTTNKTKASDYERAITPETRLITRVHPSNYRITGFTSKPTVKELAETAHRYSLLLYEDAGSGAIVDLSQFGLSDEPVIGDSIRAGADIVTFSGDKLIGGVQSGLIVGREDAIASIRRNPLYRALRVSKLVYAILESTFDAFRRGDMFEEIPVLRMISISKDDVKTRVARFVHLVRERIGDNSSLSFQVGTGKSLIGGGSAPAVEPATTLLALKYSGFSAAEIEERLRHADPPVIVRVFEGRVVLDLRTVQPDEETELAGILANLCD